MCRLFGQISLKPQSARDLLADSACSLLKQSDFNKKNLQQDGWGIGWFENDQARVVKSPKAAFKNVKSFTAAADKAVSRVVLGHLRAASNPRGIPRAKLITLDNTQPFADEGWIFIHNGTLQIPLEVGAALGPLKRRLKSHNDSEVFFYQFLKFQKRLGDPARAFKACIAETWKIWKTCRDKHPDKTAPYSSLNSIVSDGKSLHVLCHSVSRGLASFGIFHPRQPWSVMSRTNRGGRLIVASEGVDRGPWTLLRPPEIISANIVSGKIRVRRTRFAQP